ncbi:hypothetical protein COEREDRAFT_90492 [Coemansia reversa NRRL 1564]|uniref:Uncharacterized protein n=1 Tax=Coemansia reversa (strain ATCC 12441 / NRRL 1564) TaxID=763665 RepID=A0A2G5BK70_COERN|nr:hypothetical protein COEREDRAFT_90492 [Coemansia reversa NRRL 1564]|eukprot:PIA19137.1 hypothetical protein COEREDRAFT_90492 [Coemansia reversa NRRL 1564]
MSESVAKVLESVSSAMVNAGSGQVDIFDHFGVIKPGFDDRAESEMSPADMAFLTMSVFLVGGCISIVGGYYLNRALRSSDTKGTVKASADKKTAKKST